MKDKKPFIITFIILIIHQSFFLKWCLYHGGWDPRETPAMVKESCFITLIIHQKVFLKGWLSHGGGDPWENPTIGKESCFSNKRSLSNRKEKSSLLRMKRNLGVQPSLVRWKMGTQPTGQPLVFNQIILLSEVAQSVLRSKKANIFGLFGWMAHACLARYTHDHRVHLHVDPEVNFLGP